MTDSFSGHEPRRLGRRLAGLVALAVVPLVVAGVVIGALADADRSLDRIPAAIVNSDRLVQQPQADGTTTPVFAGRQLVTELTANSPGDGGSNFDWQITNADDAAKLLAEGEVYAVLTVPQSFSSSILSLQSPTPRQASLSIRTDDSHSYLSSVVADAVGAGLVSAFGEEITTRYLAGVYDSFGTVRSSLATAADGAGSLQTGATSLQAGLGGLADGAGTASTGAQSLSSGVSSYTSGVSSLASGLTQLQSGAVGLSGITSGLSSYASGVSQLSAGIAAASTQLNDADPLNDAPAKAMLQSLSGQLSGAAAGGPALASGAAAGISGVQSGVAQSASGAARLAAGGPALRSGASSLASGLTELSSGAASAQSGAGDLSTGAGTLAAGLRDGAAQVPALEGRDAERLADIVASPIQLTSSRDNSVGDFGQQLATVLIPLALWLGALAIFVVSRPFTSAVLASTAATSRLFGSRLARMALLALAQTIPLTVLIHTALGVSWALAPLSFAIVLVTALVFAAIHQVLFLALPRVAVIASVLLLALQVTVTGGVYPIELLAAPFAAASPYLPFTYAANAMQALFTVGDVGASSPGIVGLIVFGSLAVSVSAIAMVRVRSVRFTRVATG